MIENYILPLLFAIVAVTTCVCIVSTGYLIYLIAQLRDVEADEAEKIKADNRSGQDWSRHGVR
jgi:hypothetical protein